MSALAEVVYVLTFFSDKEKSIRLTEMQYDVLKSALNQTKFVEVNGSLYNASDIKGMYRTVEDRKALGRIGNFTYYSTEELDSYLESL